MRHIILASHGDFSKGLKHSVQMIVGDIADQLQTYSLYPSYNPRDYMEEMSALIQKNPEDEYVFLCDIEGGSVHSALSTLCQFPNVLVFGGTNMNLVLDLLLSTPEILINNPDVQNRLIASGKNGVSLTDQKGSNKKAKKKISKEGGKI